MRSFFLGAFGRLSKFISRSRIFHKAVYWFIIPACSTNSSRALLMATLSFFG